MRGRPVWQMQTLNTQPAEWPLPARGLPITRPMYAAYVPEAEVAKESVSNGPTMLMTGVNGVHVVDLKCSGHGAEEEHQRESLSVTEGLAIAASSASKGAGSSEIESVSSSSTSCQPTILNRQRSSACASSSSNYTSSLLW